MTLSKFFSKKGDSFVYPALRSIVDRLFLACGARTIPLLSIYSMKTGLLTTAGKSTRILAGQTAARLRGVHWGGSSPGRRIKVTAEQIASIHHLRSDGQTIAAIARATGLTRPTVYLLLGDCHRCIF